MEDKTIELLPGSHYYVLKGKPTLATAGYSKILKESGCTIEPGGIVTGPNGEKPVFQSVQEIAHHILNSKDNQPITMESLSELVTAHRIKAAFQEFRMDGILTPHTFSGEVREATQA